NVGGVRSRALRRQDGPRGEGRVGEEVVARQNPRLRHPLGGEDVRVPRVEGEELIPPAREVDEDEAAIRGRQRGRLREGLEGQAPQQRGAHEASGGLEEGPARGLGLWVLLHGSISPRAVSRGGTASPSLTRCTPPPAP